MTEKSFHVKKMAIIADVHGNLIALNKFLEYIDSEDIDLVVNLGDFVGIGPYPAETADIILDDKRFVSILGNHEVSKFLDEEYGVTSEEKAHHKWIANQIPHELLERIHKLPNQKLIVVNSSKFYLIHSRPYERMAPLIDGMPLIFLGKNLKEFAADYESPLMEPNWILFGHVHLPCYLEIFGKKYINPGALGVSQSGLASFAEIDFDEGTQVSFKQLHYDRNLVVQEIRRRKVPDAENIIKVFF